MAAPLSWAQRAKGDQLDSTTDLTQDSATTSIDSTSSRPETPPAASTSKANSSDNWRAVTPAKASAKQDKHSPQAKEQQQGGWQKMEGKKDKKSRSASHSKPHDSRPPRPRQSTATAVDKADKATAAEKQASAAPSSSSLKPTPNPSTPSSPTSWADHDDEMDYALPSPSFPAASLAPIPTTLTLESSVLPPNPSTTADEASTTAEPLDTPAPVAKEPPKILRNPAPIPKVNVWSVRKEQLASAAPAPTPSSAPTPTATATASTPAQPREPTKKEAKKARAAAAAAAAALAAASEPKVNGDSTKAGAPPTLGAPVTSSSTTPSTTTTPAPAAPKRKPEGWSGVKSSASVPVLGGDVESWPSPNEEPKEKKEKKKKGAAAGAAKEAVVAKEVEGGEAGSKKKGDKTKWIPIKADITVANSRTFNAAGPQGSETKRKGSTRRESTAIDAEGSSKGAKAPSTANAGEKKPTAPRPQATPSSSSIKSANNARGDHPLPQKPNHPTASSSASNKAANKAANAARAAQLAQSKSAADLAAVAKADAAGGANGVIRPFANKDATPAAVNSSSPAPSLPTAPRPSNAPRNTPSTRGSHASRGGRPSAGPRGGMSSSSSNPSFARGGHSGAHQLPQAQGAPVPLPMFVDGQQQAFDPNFGYPVGGGATEAMQMQMPDPRVLDPTRYWLLGQLEWWFSVDNLCRDLFLRSKMDAAGWIDISIIASFNRIKNLTTDQSIVRDTMCFTPLLEVVDDFVRLRQHWPEWILPSAIPSRVSEQRMAEAQAMGYTPLMHARQMQAMMAGKETENDEAISREMQGEEDKKEGGSTSEVKAVEEELEAPSPAPAPAVPAAVATSTIADKEEPSTVVDQEQASSEEGEDDGEGTAATTISTGSQAGEAETEGEETAIEAEAQQGGQKKSVEESVVGPTETTDAPSTTTTEQQAKTVSTPAEGAGAATAGAGDKLRSTEELAARDAAARKEEVGRP